ncbi:hypothetical protein ACFQE1_16365 [Halobium palmae]|uniref:Uncharacterized protein n=1 Tax=Halobium palmae TaxID=1776492 RepID=A0ABD5S2Q9_9EURY
MTALTTVLVQSAQTPQVVAAPLLVALATWMAVRREGGSSPGSGYVGGD